MVVLSDLRHVERFAWAVLPWTALGLSVCVGTTVGWAAGSGLNNPTCLARCVAPNPSCAWPDSVVAEHGGTIYVTMTVAQGRGNHGVPVPVPDALACADRSRSCFRKA